MIGAVSPIVFPLREKLHQLFKQQRPKSNGGRRVVLLPVLPWVDGDRPPNINYGRTQGVPVLNMNCWIGFGLCAVDDVRAMRLRDVKQPVLRPSFGGKLVPDVVHALKPLPARFNTITGQTRDGSGATLGSCVVDLYITATDRMIESVMSNGDGYYYLKGPALSVDHYIVAYKAGSPDKAGTSLNTLRAT
mgnify:CR=1 FL=1